jgi:DNA-binding GntR family transcriptional regulator
VTTLSVKPIDPDATDPLYLQVTRSISDDIAAGRLLPGRRLPSERQLCELFEISRVTVRKALAALVEEGLVESSAGRGWFVASGPVSEPPNMLTSFSAMGRARGLEPSAKVLHAHRRAAGIEEVELLDVAPGAELFDLRRLRYLDALPVAIDRCAIPVSRAPELDAVDFASASLYEELERRYGLLPSHADFSVEAAAASTETAELLELEPGAAVLVTRHRSYDQYGRALDTGELIYRADRYRFRARLSARP